MAQVTSVITAKTNRNSHQRKVATKSKVKIMHTCMSEGVTLVIFQECGFLIFFFLKYSFKFISYFWTIFRKRVHASEDVDVRILLTVWMFHADLLPLRMCVRYQLNAFLFVSKYAQSPMYLFLLY